ncbi:MAG: hypothetical protein NXH91_00670 [Phyllobacteriaceae bacterium]|jgi:hypothetical protein|nr:hypothetical protein [Phyllobacteriaceae bacterium]
MARIQDFSDTDFSHMCCFFTDVIFQSTALVKPASQDPGPSPMMGDTAARSAVLEEAAEDRACGDGLQHVRWQDQRRGRHRCIVQGDSGNGLPTVEAEHVGISECLAQKPDF